MPKFNVTVPNPMSAEEAKSRLQHFAESLEGRFRGQVKDLTQHWEGDHLLFGFKTLGMRIEGTVEIGEEQIVVSGDLPFSVMMFKGKIESEIRGELERLVGK